MPRLSPIPLEPPNLELPLAISLEHASPDIGTAAVRQCRSSGHLVCQAYLPHLADRLDYEAHLQEIAGQTSDHREGVQAFREKRRATFTGQ